MDDFLDNLRSVRNGDHFDVDSDMASTAAHRSAIEVITASSRIFDDDDVVLLNDDDISIGVNPVIPDLVKNTNKQIANATVKPASLSGTERKNKMIREAYTRQTKQKVAPGMQEAHASMFMLDPSKAKNSSKASSGLIMTEFTLTLLQDMLKDAEAMSAYFKVVGFNALDADYAFKHWVRADECGVASRWWPQAYIETALSRAPPHNFSPSMFRKCCLGLEAMGFIERARVTVPNSKLRIKLVRVTAAGVRFVERLIADEEVQ